ncbi:hypothetical protein ACHAXR_006250, partial [Thalassiosira sp. AJA248-18]
SYSSSRQQLQQLTFDNGLQVEVGRQIAEGGFSYVFEAFSIANGNNISNTSNRAILLSHQRSSSTLASSSTTTTTTTDNTAPIIKYALKRINCADHEIVQSCRHEAGVHRSLPMQHHPNLLELLGLKFDSDASRSSSRSRSSSPASSSSSSSVASHKEYNLCYMLFPYIPHSLRGEISKRNILFDPTFVIDGGGRNNNRRRQPFPTKEIVQLFGGLIDALTAMHNANISHRDVKIENILLQSNGYAAGDENSDNTTRGGRGRRRNTAFTSVLMDFGSAGPLTASQLTSRQQVLTIIENAASNTTMPYRPPELFEGGMRHGPYEMLDYGKVDVWSLGCVLFGLMHGTSPFEMEFTRSNDNYHHNLPRPQQQQQQYGLILGEVPFPPWATEFMRMGGNVGKHTIDGGHCGGTNGIYPISMYKLVRYMIHQDRAKRPNIHEVAKRFGELYLELIGERWIPYEEGLRHNDGEVGKGGQNYDDFDSLIESRDFV